MIRRILPLLALPLALGALAAPASSQPGCEDPGTDSALNAYCEELPGAKGDRGNAQGAGRSLQGRIDRAAERAPAPDPPARDGKASEPRPADPVGGFGSSIESGGSDRTGFVLLIVALALGTAALIWLLRRRRSAST